MTQQTPEQLDQNWSNYWQGRTGVQSGSALVGIENHPEIQSFWTDNLSGISKTAVALDLACGAGTVAKILDRQRFQNIYGLDISSAAIEVLSKALPNISAHVGAADAAPFEDSTFDLIVSQYGFEYGDFHQVIPEIARILKPGGRFLALSHKSKGAIHREVIGQLEAITAIDETGYIEAARELFKAAMTRESAMSQEQAEEIFRSAEVKLLELAKRNKGLAEHIYFGAQRMFQHRHRYDYKDIVLWLDGTENELKSFIGRMSSMETATIDDEKLKGFVSTFSKSGIKIQKPKILIDKANEELGWVFNGSKSKI